MKLQVVLMDEHGWPYARQGMGLSKGLTAEVPLGMTIEQGGPDDPWWAPDLPERVKNLAQRLGFSDGGHNKFLESVQVWLDVRAPRFWWQEMDTYRAGISKQSESTMYTLMKGLLTQDDFDKPVLLSYLDHLNGKIIKHKHAVETGDTDARDCLFLELKSDLPEGFLQRRVISTNYKVLRHIAWKRTTHRLPHWRQFIRTLKESLTHPEFLEFKPEDMK